MNSKNQKELFNVVEFSKELSNSYIEYAVSVITSRAIPNIRDGLKVVQRRILYSMHENLNNHNNRFRKSARVIGDVSGKYHPHGEVSIYDALVRLAQPFSTYCTLIEGQGNFGSIDGDSPAAQRYCITGDSLVPTNHGLMYIDKIFEIYEINEKVNKYVSCDINLNSETNKNLNLQIFSFNQEKIFVTKALNSGLHEVIKISTSLGFELTGTKNHPLLCLNFDEKLSFLWKQISDINCGDILILEVAKQNFSNINCNKLNNFNKKDDVNKIDYYNQQKNKLLLNDNNLAEVIGYCYGNSNNITEQFHFFNKKNRKEIIDLLVSLSIEYFEFSNKISIIDKRIYTCFDKNDINRIPEIILNGDLNVIKRFLSSYLKINSKIIFDEDLNEYLLIKVINESVGKYMQNLFLYIGIISNRNYLNLYVISSIISTIIGENIITFIKNNNIDQNIISNTLVPDLSIMINKFFKYFNKKYKNLSINDIVHAFKTQKLNNLENILDNDDKNIIINIFTKNIVLDHVFCKKYKNEQTVYSLKVDSECHSYISNGFINHNTECRLSKFGTLMIEETQEEVVDFQKNYDSSLIEPIYLTCKIPNLIINGNYGISVGFISFMPSHNPKEVFNVIKHMLSKDNYKDISYEEIINYMPGPDFPVKCLVDNQNIKQIYTTGKGVLVTSSIFSYDPKTHSILIDGLPYGVKKIRLIQSIVEEVKNKNIMGIKDIIDDSTNDDYKIKIILEEDANHEVITRRLKKYTLCSNSSGCSILFIENNYPKIFSISELFIKFIDQRIETIQKILEYEIKNLINQIEKIIALFVVTSTEQILNVIKNILNSSNSDSAREFLRNMIFNISDIYHLLPKNMQKFDIYSFKLTNIQIEYLLNTTLIKLNRQRITDLKLQISSKTNEINEKFKILNDEKEIYRIIIEDVNKIEKIANQERKCSLIALDHKLHIHDLEIEKDILMLLGKRNVILFKELSIIKAQKRGGKGKSIPIHFSNLIGALRCTSHEDILMFTKFGYAYKLSSFEIFYGGKELREIVNLKKQDEIIYVSTLSIIGKNDSIVIATVNGLIKKHNTQEFKFFNKNGKRICNLDSDDKIIKITYINKNDMLALFSKNGKFIVLENECLREYVNRNTKGSKGIKLKRGDLLYDITTISNETKDILIVNENGFAKRVNKIEMTKKISNRNSVGVKCINNKYGSFSCCIGIDDENLKIILATHSGKIIVVKIDEIPIMHRNTKGVKLINLDEDDTLIFAGII